MARRAAVFAAAVILLATAATTEARAAPKRIIERPVHSLAPDSKRVKESFVSVFSPLPDSFGPHPAACDRISYLRFRNADGPRRRKKADVIYVMIPGFIGGASTFDQVARHTVENAARHGQDAEFWALDRRANCLEDNTGVNAAADVGDASIAYAYYWHGKPANGATFPGWVSAQDAAWLDKLGLEQTMRDWYTVLRSGIRSQRLRRKKMICGGHSLGGPLTAAFAGWDFDGNPQTTKDVGYKQCAGFVGFDTRLAVNGLSGSSSLSPTGVLFQAIAASPSPYIDVPPLTPETFQLPAIFSVGTFFDATGLDLLPELPHSTNIDLAQRLLFSKDAAQFATGMPSIRDFTINNETVLAGVFDDNSEPLTFLRASIGSAAGGPLTDKNFPTPDPTLALPEDPDAPLYSWQGYRQVGANGNPVPLNDEGSPYTSRESEVTSLRQFARTMFDSPANLIEQYFPKKILSDVQDAGEGDRSGELSHLQYDGISRRPAILINAGDSSSNAGADTGRPVQGEAPNQKRLSRKITIPGYNHLDVVAAARRQNDGRAEPSARALYRFGRAVLR